MKSTAHLIIGCLAFWLIVPANYGRTAPSAVTAELSASVLAISQTGYQDQRTRQNEAQHLLRESRQAMNRGDLPLAERYIQQAEQLNVQYDPLYERFRDTPEKARRAMQAMRGSTAGTSGRPSDRFSPASIGPSAGGQPPMADRFASQPRDARGTLDMLTNDASSLARSYLEKGRLAVAQGDVTAAIAWRQKAIATGTRFAPGEYSPEALANDLRRAGVSDALLAGRGPTSPALSQPSPHDFDGASGRRSQFPSPGRAMDPRKSGFQDSLVTNPYNVTPTGGPLSSNIEPRRFPPARTEANPRRNEVLRLLATARAALDQGNARTAKALVEQAQGLRVPDRAFAAGDPRPEHLLLEINSVLSRQGRLASNERSGVVQAYYTGDPSGQQFPVRQGYYDPARDNSRNVAAQATGPLNGPGGPSYSAPNPGSVMTAPRPSSGVELYHKGIKALQNQDREAALELFAEAWKYEAELDAVTRQALRDKLTLLRVAPPPSTLPRGSALEEIDSEQKILRDKLFADISREQTAAEKMREVDPRGSLERLQRLRDRVEQEMLDPPTRRYMLTLVERGIRDAETYIQQHLPDIELTERNDAVLRSIEHDRLDQLERQNKLAELVEEFNVLMDEERYAEANLISRQAHELEPESEVVRLMLHRGEIGRRVDNQEDIKARAESGFYYQMEAVDESKIPFDDRDPLVFPDTPDWVDLADRRLGRFREQRTRMSPTEQDIYDALRTKVEVRFEYEPLSQVMDALGRMAGVNVYLDPQGLTAEGVTTDEPVLINLTEPISLRSALNLILEPLRLSYVIQNEVLRITSEQTRDTDTYSHVYNVADLVIPIPNFLPGYNVGLPGAIKEAINATGQVRQYDSMQHPRGLTLASHETGAPANASILATMDSSGMLPSVAPRAKNQMGFAPGGLGGASQADFDTLIDLITSTIAPQTWDTVGGPGSIEGFPTNLSLVVSQTQDVHEQIADLLDQLRRLQDLQVTIEVRYITLNDRYFERIGIDFDFEIDDNSNQIAGQAPILPDDTGPSMSFGIDSTGEPTLDFDYSVNQGSFSSTVPQFGGFDAATAANFGFAILSDIEVFFLLQAAQGDDRTNVLQAPKVTLFNGQTGFVSDTSQRPFVTSVIPVVGDFAAAHQPVVVVLSEGTSLSVQAVVSPDRRFVRLTLVPFFSSIGDVDTFTFHGRTSSDSGTVAADPTNQAQNVTQNSQNFTEGTTVQLPTFNFTTVSTTVSVPDGGTVLMGGIKRLSEGRNERGIPMLSKLPYVNRLFKNVGIGRDTQSLMMMVTPRIIIQEEEEFQQTGYDSSQ